MSDRPKSAIEAVAQARAEREHSRVGPIARQQIVLEQIADALIGIEWALRSGASRAPRRKSGTADQRRMVVVHTPEEAEEYRKNNPDDDATIVLTGVPRR